MSAAVADPSLEAARGRSLHLARLANVPESAEGFGRLSEEKILELQPRISRPEGPHLLHDIHELLRDGLMIGPVRDGRVVPDNTLDSLSQGVNAGVPLVLGTTDGELDGLFEPRGILDHAPRKALLRTLGATTETATAWLSTPLALGTENTIEMLGHYVTDAVFHSWVPRAVAARSDAGAGPTWSYRFRWHSDTPPQAGHCIDIPFAFDRLDAPGVEPIAGSRPPQALATAVHGGLVSFVKHLDPGWPVDTDGAGPSRIFDLPEPEPADAYASARALLDARRIAS